MLLPLQQDIEPSLKGVDPTLPLLKTQHLIRCRREIELLLAVGATVGAVRLQTCFHLHTHIIVFHWGQPKHTFTKIARS